MYEATLRRAQAHWQIWLISAVNAAVSILGWIASYWFPMAVIVLAVPGILLGAWGCLYSTLLRAAVAHYFRYLEWKAPPPKWREAVTAWLTVIPIIIALLLSITRTLSPALIWILISLMSTAGITWNVRLQFTTKGLFTGKARNLTPGQTALLVKLERVLGWHVVPDKPAPAPREMRFLTRPWVSPVLIKKSCLSRH